MRQSWQMWSSVVPHNICNDIILKSKESKEVAGSIMSGEGTDYRKSNLRWIQDSETHSLLWGYAKEANQKAFGFDLTDISPVQFTEYRGEDESKYDWHHDVDWEQDTAFDRKVSVVLQLTNGDSYEGGDFQFKEVETPDQKALRAKGTVLCFPSYQIHRVTPVIKGVRNSLVAWFEGPRWR